MWWGALRCIQALRSVHNRGNTPIKLISSSVFLSSGTYLCQWFINQVTCDPNFMAQNIRATRAIRDTRATRAVRGVHRPPGPPGPSGPQGKTALSKIDDRSIFESAGFPKGHHGHHSHRGHRGLQGHQSHQGYLDHKGHQLTGHLKLWITHSLTAPMGNCQDMLSHLKWGPCKVFSLENLVFRVLHSCVWDLSLEPLSCNVVVIWVKPPP